MRPDIPVLVLIDNLPYSGKVKAYMISVPHVRIVRDAPPSIQCDADSPEPVRFAAEELRGYLGMIFEADLPAVATDGDSKIRIAVQSDPELGDEGFRIVSAERGLEILGGGPLGALYGVYEFLRRYGGCSFAGLPPDGEYVPHRNEINVEGLPLSMKPRLWYRGMQFSFLHVPELSIARIDWMAKNGMNYVMYRPQPDDDLDGTTRTIDPATGQEIVQDATGKYSDNWFTGHVAPHVRKRGLKLDMNHHNLMYWLPPARYFEEHPDWYMMQDGKRVAAHLQICICTSNREAVAQLIANVKDYLRSHPDVKVVGVIPEDGYGMCQCEGCLAMDVSLDDAFRPLGDFKDASGENRSKIRRYALLVNEVARSIRDEFPDVCVGRTGYVDIQWPPRDVEMEPNILPYIGIYWRCNAHPMGDDSCATNRFYFDLVRRWREQCSGRFIVYTFYMGMEVQKSLPFPIADVICRDWQAYKVAGVDGATLQSRSGSHNVYALNYLAFARSGWDDNVDADRLLDEYLLGMFGNAGESLRPIFESFAESTRRIEREGPSISVCLQGKAPGLAGAAGECLLPDGYSTAFFLDELGEDKLDRCVSEAVEAACDDREARQVSDFAAAVKYWKLAAEFSRAYHRTFDPSEDLSESELNEMRRHAGHLAETVLDYVKSLPKRGWVDTNTLTKWRIMWSQVTGEKASV